MTTTIRERAKQIPALASLYRFLRYRRLKPRTTEQTFTEIFRNNTWCGRESASGTGSSIEQTKIIVGELPELFDTFAVSTVLDIPCGDFHWMKDVDLSRVDYTGADIVGDLIRKNSDLHSRSGVRFEKLDIIASRLPTVDLIFCRDCLVHLSYKDIFRALDNVCKSQSVYFLTTTFTKRSENRDIATGQWRTLDLEIAPFDFPPPIRTINEACSEHNGAYRDKALGLWRISDIQERLRNTSGNGPGRGDSPSSLENRIGQ
jgi:hypothetical protein